MATTLPRLTLTLKNEWERDLDTLKRTEFYDKTRADVLRYLIELGLQTWHKENEKAKKKSDATG